MVQGQARGWVGNRHRKRERDRLNGKLPKEKRWVGPTKTARTLPRRVRGHRATERVNHKRRSHDKT